jgi:hypothetical protein
VLYRVQHEEPDLGGCPAVLREVIEGCLTKDPAGRPSPVSLIEACRDRAAGKTVEFSDSWLPSALAADLTRHAAPAALAEAGPQAGLAAGHAEAAPGDLAGGLGDLAGGLGDLAGGLGGLAGGLGGLAGGPGDLPGVAGDLVPGPGDSARGLGDLAGGPRRGWRDLPRGVLAGAAVAAVLLAALAGYGVFALTRPGSSPGAAAGAPRPPRLARGAGDRARKKTPASPAPSPAPTTVAQCLIGTWTETGEDDPATFNGIPVVWTGGAGVIQIFEPSGINVFEYHHATYTVQLNGTTWTDVENGRASVHYVLQNGVLLSSNLSASGTIELLENGAYDKSGPLTLNTDPDNVTCSGNTLHIYTPNGGSTNLTRDVPNTPSGS